MSSPASPRRADPMEDFLAREKAALEALESVEITSPSAEGAVAAMEIDEPMGEFHTSQPTRNQAQSASPLASQAPLSAGAGVRSGLTSPPVGGAAPILTSTVQALNSNAADSPRSPTSPVGSSAHGSRPETEAMSAWKKQRASSIAEREAAAQQLRAERQAKAASELKALQREWQERVESCAASGGAGREKSKLSTWDEEKPAGKALRKEQVPWDRVHVLMEMLPKPAKDCSRLISIVKSLTQEEEERQQ